MHTLQCMQKNVCACHQTYQQVQCASSNVHYILCHMLQAIHEIICLIKHGCQIVGPHLATCRGTWMHLQVCLWSTLNPSVTNSSFSIWCVLGLNLGTMYLRLFILHINERNGVYGFRKRILSFFVNDIDTCKIKLNELNQLYSVSYLSVSMTY